MPKSKIARKRKRQLLYQQRQAELKYLTYEDRKELEFFRADYYECLRVHGLSPEEAKKEVDRLVQFDRSSLIVLHDLPCRWASHFFGWKECEQMVMYPHVHDTDPTKVAPELAPREQPTLQP